MYSPTLGRFLQPDPIGYADGMNLYACVGNDPVNATDPTGTEMMTCTGSMLKSEDCSGVAFLSINGTDTTMARMGAQAAVGGASSLTASQKQALVHCYIFGCSFILNPGAGGPVLGEPGDIVVTAYRRYVYAGLIAGAGLGGGAFLGPQNGDIIVVGQLNGLQTYGNNPRVGRPVQPWYPNGRINSDLPGGLTGAWNDLDRIAQLNGITPPSNKNPVQAAANGWVPSYNTKTGYAILTHTSGLEIRFNGANLDTRITIPVGLLIAPNTPSTYLPETIHYRGF
jgi:uncharacterized protein RhaS with RHS repeats